MIKLLMKWKNYLKLLLIVVLRRTLNGGKMSLSLYHTHTHSRLCVEILMKMVIIFADGADLWVPS